MLIKEIKFLVLKDIKLELRQKFALNSILLYVVSSVFISYLSFRSIIHPATWNALFWIIILFSSIHAVGKSFILDSKGRQLYFYTLVSPEAIIISKIIYNVMLVTLVSFICLAVYCLLIGNLIVDFKIFVAVLLLGSMGLSSILTMISAIASKTSNNFTIMAILSFPLLIPLLITAIKASKNAIDGLAPSVSYGYLLVLLLINLIVTALSFVLFPYIWKD